MTTDPMELLRASGRAAARRMLDRRIPSEVETVLEGGAHQVYTVRSDGQRLLHGSIRGIGAEQGGTRPSVRWRLADPAGRQVGEHVGDFVDAVARLLSIP